ncbi:hypothetical protein Tco_1534122, partial [Tanacetum coccineum]
RLHIGPGHHSANTIQSLDASDSANDQGNQLKPVDDKKVLEHNVEKELKFAGLTSLGDDQIIKEAADSDLHSILDDEVNLVSGFEASGSTNREYDSTGSKVEPSQSDEATVDNILDEKTDLKAFTAKPSDPLGLLQAET